MSSLINLLTRFGLLKLIAQILIGLGEDFTASNH